ncbi:ArdC family protein [Desulfolucanica intricata]|uniref:ArdC family protein n=1 Tax=Desulfolucanica intricata TaxID=1285191 RepID=UPI00082ADAA9|nr:ArdC family protein [Desulfolucanica intricata]
MSKNETKNRKDLIESATKSLLDMFASGNLPPAIARTVIAAKKGYNIPSVNWSLGNQILMLAAGTTDARGYAQWKKVGRYVKKGSKAIYILGPCTKKITDEESGEEKVIITGFKGIPVYRYEDTEGEDIPTVDYAPPELPPLVEVAKKYGVKVQYGPSTGRFYGCYRPSDNSILLCTHDVDTFFHELAHAIHGTIRPLKGGQHQDQEVVAETVATVLCILYGYDGYVYQGFDYIKHYAQEHTANGVIKAIMKVLADVQAVLKLILDASDADKKMLNNIAV